MLLIHWAKQNNTKSILANGLRPACRSGQAKNPTGVYVYPFPRNKTPAGNWRRNLKQWDNALGNYNGFVFALTPADFPLLAGYWFLIRGRPEAAAIHSIDELMEKHGSFFSGSVVDAREGGTGYNWTDFEIIFPRRVEPRRMIRIIKDREQRRRTKALWTSSSFT